MACAVCAVTHHTPLFAFVLHAGTPAYTLNCTRTHTHILLQLYVLSLSAQGDSPLFGVTVGVPVTVYPQGVGIATSRTAPDSLKFVSASDAFLDTDCGRLSGQGGAVNATGGGAHPSFLCQRW